VVAGGGGVHQPNGAGFQRHERGAQEDGGVRNYAHFRHRTRTGDKEIRGRSVFYIIYYINEGRVRSFVLIITHCVIEFTNKFMPTTNICFCQYVLHLLLGCFTADVI
jgi:hypothetical protein